MASQRQIDANRRNARLSTGPKTPEGKAAAARNALKHGLLANNAVLPQENTQAFLELLAALRAQHQPPDPLEDFLVQQMATAQWRLDRLTRIETGLLASCLDEARDRETPYDDEDDDEEEAAPEPASDAQSAQRDYDQTTRLLGLSFHHDTSGAESLSKLSRYENTIRRAFYRALYALHFAQARRMGQPPPRMPR